MPEATHLVPADLNYVETLQPKLWSRRGTASAMPHSHRHDDLELNLVLKGRLDYLFGGTRLTVSAGQLALFWAATPHRLVDSTADEVSDICWVHIPLSVVLGWGLRSVDVSEVLQGRPVILPAEAAGRDVEPMFTCWIRDIEDQETELIALLEAQALVRRLLDFHRKFGGTTSQPEPPGFSVSASMLQATGMARFIVSHFREPIGPSDVAESAHLNSNYAMSLFRRSVGTTLGDYLTRCRISEAQRLLLTTKMTASEIAHASGFGSQSSFYAHFARMCGSSPGEYRALHR